MIYNKTDQLLLETSANPNTYEKFAYSLTSSKITPSKCHICGEHAEIQSKGMNNTLRRVLSPRKQSLNFRQHSRR